MSWGRAWFHTALFAALLLTVDGVLAKKARRNGGLEAVRESSEVLGGRPSSPALEEELEEEQDGGASSSVEGGGVSEDTSEGSVTSEQVPEAWTSARASEVDVAEDDLAGSDDIDGLQPEAPAPDLQKLLPSGQPFMDDQGSSVGSAVSMASHKKVKLSNATSEASNSSTLPLDAAACSPPCIEGRGICNDDVCFCRHPYQGLTCHENAEQDDNVRPTHVQLAALCAVATFVGLVVGIISFSCYVDAITSSQKFGGTEPRKEVWRPAS